MHNLWFTVETNQPQALPKTWHIQRHLTRFEGEIQSQHQVCLISHLVTLKENKAISTDSDFKKLRHLLPTNPLCWAGKNPIRCDEHSYGQNSFYYGKCITRKSIYATALAFIPCKLCSRFCQSWRPTGTSWAKSFSSRWVLSELTAQLKKKHHRRCSYKVCKYGTLVYGPNSDLILLLSKATWQLWSIESTSSERPGERVCVNKPNADQLDYINRFVHSQIKMFLAKGCPVTIWNQLWWFN